MKTQVQYGLPQNVTTTRFHAIWWYMAFLLVNALIASSVATQWIASAFNNHVALGAPLWVTSWGTVYAPWKWFIWSNAFPDSWEIMEEGVSQGQFAFVVPQVVVLCIIMAIGRKPKGHANLHGSARWAVKGEIEQSGLLTNNGVYVGGWQDKKTLHYLRHNGPEHILVFAPTRSGKGVSMVLPTLLSWPESALILDIKGENWALTAGWRKQQGHRVLRFDPKDLDTSVRFNPLESIRILEPEAVQDAQAVASMILDPDGKGMKDYFDKAGFAFFIGAILHCLVVVRHEQKRVANLCDLSLMLANPDMDVAQLLDTMIETDHAAMLGNEVRFAHEIHNNIAASAKEMKNKADRELSGVLSTAGVNLALYRDPTIAYITGHSDFHIEDLMNFDHPVSLYLVISPSDLDRLRPLVRLILNVILCRLTERMSFRDGRSVCNFRHRLLLMLDEFTSFGKLEIFERALAFMAGYGLKCCIIVQDLTQLQKEYTKDGSIMSNCHIRVAYTPNTPETARLLSEMTGKTTVVEHKTSVSGSRTGRLKNASVSITETARPLLTPDEVLRLPAMQIDKKGKIIRGGDMLIFMAGMSVIYGRQPLYFLDPTFSARAKIKSPVLSDRLYGQHGETDESVVTLEKSCPEPAHDYAAFLAQVAQTAQEARHE